MFATNQPAGVAFSEKTWAFMSRDASTGINYIGGFYRHAAAASDFSGGPSFGTVNASYAAHFYVVLGAAAVDVLTLTVTGTSIDDAGTRTASDTASIVIADLTAVDTYFETTKKWLGAVVITVASGTAKICDYGFVKYWDNNNQDFVVDGFEATWLGAQNDAAPNIELLHHRATGWTYTGTGATPPAAVAAMATDHGAESLIKSDEEGSWKRGDLSEAVNGGDGEGTIIRLTTTAARAYAIGNFVLRIS